ncbi:MAG: hypothetical protein HY516_05095 [Candidatus Aenigmarchaeota archaeon]|nr:hypothetical protein [Candidatus Aenigmarchaeota archaeon]
MDKNVTNRTLHSRVRAYIGSHPFVSNVIAAGIVNYSALARRIQKEIGGNVETIKVALLREGASAVKFTGYDEEKVRSLLKNSRMSLQDNTAVVISEDKLNIPRLISIEITANNIYIVDQTKLEVGETKRIRIVRDLVALVINSPERLEKTPGVIAFLAQYFASQNINIRELISCYTDTVIVLDRKDASKAFELFRDFVIA